MPFPADEIARVSDLLEQVYCERHKNGESLEEFKQTFLDFYNRSHPTHCWLYLNATTYSLTLQDLNRLRNTTKKIIYGFDGDEVMKTPFSKAEAKKNYLCGVRFDHYWVQDYLETCKSDILEETDDSIVIKHSSNLK